MKAHSSSTGRLNQMLDPRAHKIIYPTKEKVALISELDMLLTLNEAHLVALSKQKFIPMSSIKKILKLMTNLRNENFLSLLNKASSRGTYLLLENYLIEKLGINIVGSLHIGRSRNDINATSFKLSMRSYFKTIFLSLYKLRSTLLMKAKQYSNIVMPVYSQYQVAQIGTYSHYLLAIEEALARDQQSLKDLLYSLNECPLGAGAGCGTSFSIDYQLIASLLGFSHSSNNALDAVADRDLGLRILSTLTIAGTHLSRIAQDYQIWTTQEFSFFELPDTLCGSSSMMPQKRNPYLFEVIKGKASSLNGTLVQAMTAMHNVPFSNSIEVGTEALLGINNVFESMCDILELADLLIGNAIPIEQNMNLSIHKGIAMATGIAETRVRESSLPFRQVHHEIGAEINKAIIDQVDPVSEIFKKFTRISEDHKAINWAHNNEYGGGPGKNSSKKAYQNAKQRLKADMLWLSRAEKFWMSSGTKLKNKVRKIMER